MAVQAAEYHLVSFLVAEDTCKVLVFRLTVAEDDEGLPVT